MEYDSTADTINYIDGKDATYSLYHTVTYETDYATWTFYRDVSLSIDTGSAKSCLGIPSMIGCVLLIIFIILLFLLIIIGSIVYLVYLLKYKKRNDLPEVEKEADMDNVDQSKSKSKVKEIDQLPSIEDESSNMI